MGTVAYQLRLTLWQQTSNTTSTSPYLKFFKPHQRQYKYFSINFDEATSLVNASANMPNLNCGSPLASQLDTTRVAFIQNCRSSDSKLLQSRKLGMQNEIPAEVSFAHSALQQACCRPMDNRYHEAPNTCTSRKWVEPSRLRVKIT